MAVRVVSKPATAGAGLRAIVLVTALAAALAAAARGDDAPPAPGAGARTAGRAPLRPFGRVRKLEGDEFGRACDARNRADLRRAGHEARYHSGPAYPRNDPAAEADFAAVVAAYREASATFPATEIDCYCRQRLSGAYQYRGELDKALEEAKRAAELFDGTSLAPEAQMSVGLIYLQALHQPREAELWFRRVQSAAAAMQSPEEREKWRAAAAQVLERCTREAPPEEGPAPKPAGN